jgi:hypothetical protein
MTEASVNLSPLCKPTISKLNNDLIPVCCNYILNLAPLLLVWASLRRAFSRVSLTIIKHGRARNKARIVRIVVFGGNLSGTAE